MKTGKTSTSRRLRVREQPPPTTRRVVRYLESSTLVAAIVERRRDAIAALAPFGEFRSSALTFTEAGRTIIRARASGRVRDADFEGALHELSTIESRCESVSVTPAILLRCRQPFPVEPVRTLDAIHLATIEAIGGPDFVEVITSDRRIAANARALGYRVIGA